MIIKTGKELSNILLNWNAVIDIRDSSLFDAINSGKKYLYDKNKRLPDRITLNYDMETEIAFNDYAQKAYIAAAIRWGVSNKPMLNRVLEVETVETCDIWSNYFDKDADEFIVKSGCIILEDSKAEDINDKFYLIYKYGDVNNG